MLVMMEAYQSHSLRSILKEENYPSKCFLNNSVVIVFDCIVVGLMNKAVRVNRIVSNSKKALLVPVLL